MGPKAICIDACSCLGLHGTTTLTTIPTPQQYKKPYRIHLEQFPPNANLHLQIVGVPETPDGLSALGTGGAQFKRTIAGSAAGGMALTPLVVDAEGKVDVSTEVNSLLWCRRLHPHPYTSVRPSRFPDSKTNQP